MSLKPADKLTKNSNTATYMIEADKEQFKKFQQATDLKIVENHTNKVLTFRNTNHYNTERKIQ